MKKGYRCIQTGVFNLVLIPLLFLTTACVRPQDSTSTGPTSVPPEQRERETGEEEENDGWMETGEAEGPFLIIKSENPVLADNQKVLEELEKEVAELLKILDSMDTIESSELNF